MKYEYDITILTGNSHQLRAALNEKGAQGWDNYAIIGSTAYFRRVIAADPVQAVVKPRELRKA